jgi:hypothetical protein
MSMAKANPKRDAEWEEAKKLCRLNEDTVKMAKEMGLNPRSLIKNIPNKTQLWKAPVHTWIREMYENRQEKAMKKQKRKEPMEKQGEIQT